MVALVSVPAVLVLVTVAAVFVNVGRISAAPRS
jgi:hypothetical protein